MLLYAFRHFPLVNRGQTGRSQDILDSTQLRLEEYDTLLELELDLLTDLSLNICILEQLIILGSDLVHICLILYLPLINCPFHVKDVVSPGNFLIPKILRQLLELRLDLSLLLEILLTGGLNRITFVLSTL